MAAGREAQFFVTWASTQLPKCPRTWHLAPPEHMQGREGEVCGSHDLASEITPPLLPGLAGHTFPP